MYKSDPEVTSTFRIFGFFQFLSTFWNWIVGRNYLNDSWKNRVLTVYFQILAPITTLRRRQKSQSSFSIVSSSILKKIWTKLRPKSTRNRARKWWSSVSWLKRWKRRKWSNLKNRHNFNVFMYYTRNRDNYFLKLFFGLILPKLSREK